MYYKGIIITNGNLRISTYQLFPNLGTLAWWNCQMPRAEYYPNMAVIEYGGREYGSTTHVSPGSYRLPASTSILPPIVRLHKFINHPYQSVTHRKNAFLVLLESARSPPPLIPGEATVVSEYHSQCISVTITPSITWWSRKQPLAYPYRASSDSFSCNSIPCKPD